QLHRLDGLVRRAMAGDEEHRHAWVETPQFLVRVQAGLIGKLDVEDHGVRTMVSDEFQPFACSRRGQELYFGLPEGTAKGVQDLGLVVNDEQRRHAHLSLLLGWVLWKWP